MFKTEKLTSRMPDKDFEILDLQLKIILKDYYNFLTSKVDDQMKEKLSQVYDDMICYVVDRSNLIPRTLYGESKPFIIPHRADTFVRETIPDEVDPQLIHLKSGIALFYKEYMMGTFCHEMNHAFSGASQFSIAEDGVRKDGLKLRVVKNDNFVDITGNLIDEGITDAIAAYYYNTHSDFIKEVFDNCPNYSCAYDSLRSACEILLGKDLSNKKLLDAYFGDEKAMSAFEKEFDEVMKDEGIRFSDILKASFDYEDSVDGASYTDQQLRYYFSKYQLNTCKNEQELQEKWQWLKEKGVTEEFINTFDASEASLE